MYAITVEQRGGYRLIFRTESPEGNPFQMIGQALQEAGKLTALPLVVRDSHVPRGIRIFYRSSLRGFRSPREVIVKHGRHSKQLYQVRPPGM